MKIGILTHHYVKNYGAFLQMKGMYETLQRLYPEAEVTVINYVNQKHWRRNIIHILHFRPGVDTLSTYVEKILVLNYGSCFGLWYGRSRVCGQRYPGCHFER